MRDANRESVHTFDNDDGEGTVFSYLRRPVSDNNYYPVYNSYWIDNRLGYRTFCYKFVYGYLANFVTLHIGPK